MKIQIKPHAQNHYPIGAVLIKGDSVAHWLHEIQSMGISLQYSQGFPIPYSTPNSVWGCLFICHQSIDREKTGRNSLCQNIDNRLFIPENTLIYPRLSEEEFNKLFEDCPHFLHPELGLVELNKPINWESYLLAPNQNQMDVKPPAESVFIPSRINAFQIVAMEPEELLKDLEDKMFPQKANDLEDKPLTPLEKVKLNVLKKLFEKESEKGDLEDKPGAMSEKIQQWLAKNGGEKWLQQMQNNYQDLDRRNQKELDKLLDMFKKDPKEALKYAIPLSDGTSRGASFPLGESQFTFNKRWLNFSLFGSQQLRGGNGGGSMLDTNVYDQLRKQYTETAQELIKKGEHYEAAFIYLKLLKNHYLAAQTLENGKLYSEAASVYLKYVKDKQKAAHCYEQGKMYTNAIDLYKELNKNEKVGDLYNKLSQRGMANTYYQKVVDDYQEQYQYVKAALIYRDKMGESNKAQETFLEGWRTNRDSFNCLNNYFVEHRKKEQNEWEAAIEHIYKEETNPKNIDTFLKVLKYEYNVGNDEHLFIKDMAYEIISKRARKNVNILSELNAFNKEDKILRKDIMRYRQNKHLL